jgi:DNA-binding response OmpR family regulator
MNKKVMIVEDQEDLLEIIADSIEDFGYEVEKAASAEEALEKLHKGSIKVQLVDLQLPGMSGIDYCRKIREDDNISILYAMTGFASVFHLMECRQVGFDDYFIKPVKLELLKKSLDDAFDKLQRWKKGK